MPHRKAYTIAMIRALRAFGGAQRRRRLPRQGQPDAIRLAYYQGILEVLDVARQAVAREVLPHLPDLLRQAQALRGDAISPPPVGPVGRARTFIDRAVSLFERQLIEQERRLHDLAHRIADRTSSFQREQLAAQVRAGLGVDLPLREPGMQERVGDFVSQNVAFIQSVPWLYLDQVEALVLQGVREGRRHEDLSKDLQERIGVAKSKADLIAVDQVGKFYSELNRIRQQELGVTRFVWRTANDGRVRDEHRPREGQLYSYSDPPDGELPGMPVRCRCYGEPDFSDVLEELAK